MFLKGKPDPYYGKIFLPSEQQKAVFFGVRRSGSRLKQVGPDDTLINVAEAARTRTTPKKALSGSRGLLVTWIRLSELYEIIISYEFSRSPAPQFGGIPARLPFSSAGPQSLRKQCRMSRFHGFPSWELIKMTT